MDLNNLLSTVITSTAALVAILGGFLVSRVISISSEQNGIKRSLREIYNDIDAKKEMISGLKRYLFEDDLDDFITVDNIKLLYKGKNLKEIIEEDDFTLLEFEELESHFKDLTDITEEVYKFIEVKDKIPEDLSELCRHYERVNHPKRKVWYERSAEAMEELLEESRPSSSSTFPSIAPPLANMRSYSGVNLDYKDKKRECGKLENEIKILELQKEEQLKILKEYGNPKWIISGLMVLLYATIVGIVYPSILLPYNKGIYDDILIKWIVLCLFFSHLVMLFIYLFTAMIKLSRIE